MQLNEYTAGKIVERSYAIVGFPINVMNNKGIIVASSDLERINTVHDGAVEVLRTGNVVKLDKAAAKLIQGAKEGINIPIVFQNEIIGVIGVGGPIQVVEELAQLVNMATELILENLDLVSKLHTDRKYKEDLLELLIKPNHPDNDYIDNLSQFIKYDLTGNKVVGIIKISNVEIMTATLFQELIDEIYMYDKGLLVSTFSMFKREIVVLKNSDKNNTLWIKDLVRYMENHKGLAIRAALGGGFPELDGIALSYQTARLAIENRMDARKKVVCYSDDIVKYQFGTLENAPWVKAQLRHPLTELESVDPTLVLVLTIKTYLMQNCDQQQTCKKLGIHRNTLRYRLTRIGEITSLDFNKLSDLFKMYAAINYYA
ncbi:CdaR family transcriptional regulator [Vibrio tritonius]|uniref:CdaR family transcriptional regulator n=1 Tax=Vibrio tritonius TaxID=1435069 RepID=UPI0008388102|nr:sugar diacid recognition domain-containing protein [Vibrio tritonius]